MNAASDSPPAGALHLRRGRDGIWVADSADSVAYPPLGHAECLQVEDASFWFRHRNGVIGSVLRRFPPGGTLFDIGGGNGFVAAYAQGLGIETVLVEPGRAGAENARARGVGRVVCATLDAAGFPRDSLPSAGLFDVLEHVEDDTAFLRSLLQLVHPGGRLYLTVPSHQALWSDSDVDAHHYRRYDRETLVARLRDAGWQVEFESYFFAALVLPILAFRALPHRAGFRRAPGQYAREHRIQRSSGLVATLLSRYAAWECARIASARIGFGASCIAVARRP